MIFFMQSFSRNALILPAILAMIIAVAAFVFFEKNFQVPEKIAADKNAGESIEPVDPTQISVNISPAYVDARVGKSFEITVINLGKYRGYYSLQPAFSGDENLFLFDSNQFLLQGKSSKIIAVKVSDQIKKNDLPKKAMLCAARFVGTETISQAQVIIKACGVVTITE